MAAIRPPGRLILHMDCLSGLVFLAPGFFMPPRSRYPNYDSLLKLLLVQVDSFLSKLKCQSMYL
ncbi:hypothetical protein GCM10007160_37910 [Litchfieldella qijiaojingensis]|uniref:Uncharacterized protein n=1 Tax=Litchfieldella qijiaojingensis TaxID=980347 RepID=A0ABQ2ZA30_9GAMM|nr:hypothetical protein GCM10007160_37910 [Halomonas qijiaojingensis]